MVARQKFIVRFVIEQPGSAKSQIGSMTVAVDAASEAHATRLGEQMAPAFGEIVRLVSVLPQSPINASRTRLRI